MLHASNPFSPDVITSLHMIRQMHQHLTVNPDRILPWWMDGFVDGNIEQLSSNLYCSLMRPFSLMTVSFFRSYFVIISIIIR